MICPAQQAEMINVLFVCTNVYVCVIYGHLFLDERSLKVDNDDEEFFFCISIILFFMFHASA